MSEPFLGEIRTFAFNFAPKGWAFCQGQLLSINQNTALFSLLGTMYGGNGQTTFGLPNLQGRAPLHVGLGSVQGQVGGEETHVLTTSEMPSHNHPVNARPTPAVGSPTGALWAASSKTVFAASSTTTMSAAALSTTGNNQAHDNMPPYLVLNFAIALQGIFPSRN
jgi:microcystin-dependent protein